MLQVEIKAKKYSIPEKLDECSKVQLLSYLRLFVQDADQIYTVNDGERVVADIDTYKVSLRVLLMKLLNVKRSLFLKINTEELERLINEEKLLDFFFNDYLTVNKIESIGLFSKLYGPVRQFHQLSFDEFRHAYSQYKLFINEGDNEALDLLIAILYRPRRKDKLITGDVREPLNIHSIDHRLPVVKRQPHAVKLAILKYFSGNMLLLKYSFPVVFEEKGGESRNKDGDFLDTALSLSAESKESLSDILSEGVYLAFKRIEAKINLSNQILEQINEAK